MRITKRVLRKTSAKFLPALLKIMFRFFKKKKLGLQPLPHSDKDFSLGIFGWTYKPKHTRHVLSTLSVKDQRYNTCQWNSWTASKEIDEKIKLSPKCFVALGKRDGLIKGDGYSNLRSGELIGQKCGVCSEKLLPEGSRNQSWRTYSSPTLTSKILEDAEKHKTQTFWRIYNANQAYKALDEGHPVKFGVSWRTSMNMVGGFGSPWILDFTTGRLAGGHAIFAKGYDMNYEGQRVLICQNSYGERYGDNGTMYINESDFETQISMYGCYANLDIPIDIAKWLVDHDGKLVKELNGTDVYLIEGGKKRKFSDTATMYSHNYLDEDIILDGQAMLIEIEDGDDMSFWNGNAVKTIKALILRDKGIFKKYFLELFQE